MIRWQNIVSRQEHNLKHIWDIFHWWVHHWWMHIWVLIHMWNWQLKCIEGHIEYNVHLENIEDSFESHAKCIDCSPRCILEHKIRFDLNLRLRPLFDLLSLHRGMRWSMLHFGKHQLLIHWPPIHWVRQLHFYF